MHRDVPQAAAAVAVVVGGPTLGAVPEEDGPRADTDVDMMDCRTPAPRGSASGSAAGPSVVGVVPGAFGTPVATIKGAATPQTNGGLSSWAVWHSSSLPPWP